MYKLYISIFNQNLRIDLVEPELIDQIRAQQKFPMENKPLRFTIITKDYHYHLMILLYNSPTI